MVATKFDDIFEFLQAADLDDVIVHEERGRRVLWDDGTLPDDIPSPTVSLGVNVTANVLSYRFRMVLADSTAEYVADFESVYTVADADEVEVDNELQQEFARKVAFMAVYPFLRASIFASAARLGAPRPVLGLVRQGEFEAGDAMSQEEVRATFFDNRSELQR